MLALTQCFICVERLNVGDSYLTGMTIPSEMGLLTHLGKCCCQSYICVYLCGVMPNFAFPSIVALNLHSNGLMGTVPSEIGLLTSLGKFC